MEVCSERHYRWSCHADPGRVGGRRLPWSWAPPGAGAAPPRLPDRAVCTLGDRSAAGRRRAGGRRHHGSPDGDGRGPRRAGRGGRVRGRGEIGPIEVLMCVAGVIQVGPLTAFDRQDFAEAIDIMLWGPINTALAVLPAMRRRRRGRIGIITSIGGLISAPHLLPYSTAKHGAAGFGRGLRSELAGTGISVTTVAPGLMRTGSHLRARFRGDVRREYAWFATAASLPVLSMDAGRAARLIVTGVARGAPGGAVDAAGPSGFAGRRVGSPGWCGRLGHHRTAAADMARGHRGSGRGGGTASGGAADSASQTLAATPDHSGATIGGTDQRVIDPHCGLRRPGHLGRAGRRREGLQPTRTTVLLDTVSTSLPHVVRCRRCAAACGRRTQRGRVSTRADTYTRPGVASAVSRASITGMASLCHSAMRVRHDQSEGVHR